MSNMTAIESEIQQRGKAFSQALEQLKRKYNCTMTFVPKWLPNVSGTFVLGYDEQVRIGPAPPAPMPIEPEEETDA